MKSNGRLIVMESKKGNKMKKIIVGILLVIVALGIWKYQNHPIQNEPNKPIIKIGATFPLTDNLAFLGNGSKNGMSLALEKWKNQNTKYDYELIFSDDFFDVKKSALNANRLIKLNKVNAIFSLIAGGAMAVNPIAEENKIIHMTVARGDRASKGLYNFNSHTQYNLKSDMMIDYLRDSQIKSISLFVGNNVGSIELADILEKKLKAANIIILDKQVFNPGIRDFKMMIQKSLTNGTPDIFYIDGFTPDGTLFAKALKEITGDLKLTTINDFVEPEQRDIFNGLTFVQSAYGTDEFKKIYETKYNAVLPILAASSYDNLDMLIWAYENTLPRAGDKIPTNEDIANTLLSIEHWQGVSGNLNVEPTGMIRSKPSLSKIVDGQSVIIKE